MLGLQKIHLQITALLAFLTLHAAAWRTIAHRGVFHDKLDVYNTAENSIDSILRAPQIDGVAGLEIDIQVTADGVLLAFHDKQLTRQTIKDGGGGKINALSVQLGHQKAPAPMMVAHHRASYIVGTPMKVYGKGGHLINTESHPKVATLEDTLKALQGQRPRAGFYVMLDCQTSYIADKAAAIVKRLGMQKTVYLKIWAATGINSVGYKYYGANTCYEYARKHGWSGINIIPEINELQLAKGNQPEINVFGTNLKIGQYLDCWANAQRDHAGNGAAFMPMVSSMMPNQQNSRAVEAAAQAMQWAEKNKRQKVSVIVMPDVCSVNRGRRSVWRFFGEKVGAFNFDDTQYYTRKQFCDRWADYCVVDVMGDFENFSQSSDYRGYLSNLCAP